MTHHIMMKDARTECIVAPNPPKESKSKEGAHKFTRTYLQYNYGTPDSPKIDKPCFEMQKVNATIKSSKFEGENRTQWKLNFSIDDEEDVKGCQAIDRGLANVIEKHRKKFGQYSFTADNPVGMYGCHFLPRNDEGELIEGRNPIMSVKINDESFFRKIVPRYDTTGSLLKNNDGSPCFSEEAIKYKALEGMRFDCAVVINIRDLFFNGTMPRPQIFCSTCWILSKPSKAGSIDGNKSQIVNNFLLTATREEMDDVNRSLDPTSFRSETAPAPPVTVALKDPDNDNEAWVPNEEQRLDMSSFSPNDASMTSHQL